MKKPIEYFEEKNEGASCTCMKDGIIWPNVAQYGAGNEQITNWSNMKIE